jgi:transcriptional regulator with XRE-family HTH domain
MNKQNVAKMLKAYRQANNYSIREMADLLYMSKSSYDRLERELTQPGYEQIQRIIELLQIKPDTYREIDTKGRPVGTIAYLKRGLLYGSISTEIALNCFKDFADALNCQTLQEWAYCETEGYYKDKEQIPEYRILRFNYEIEYEQGGQKYFLSLPSEFLDRGGHIFCTSWPHPVDEPDDEWIGPRGKIVILNSDFRVSLEQELQKSYGQDLHLLSAAGWITIPRLRKVLLAVHEIILSFLLNLETEFGPAADISLLRTHRHRLGALFRNIINTVELANHLVLPSKPRKEEELTLIKGDEERFLDWLDQHEIGLYEQDEFFVLREGLADLSLPEGVVPPELCEWAKKVSSSNWRFRLDETKLLNGLKVLYGVKEE